MPGCWEISTGSVAFSPPLGIALIELAAGSGLIDEGQKAAYDSLTQNAQRDGLVKELLNTALASPPPTGFNFDGLGLDSSLELETGIDFDEEDDVLAGDHALAVHYFAWTQFEIDQATGELTVTTFGIDAYTEAELIADPDGVTGREPRILQQFRVRPQDLDE